MSVQASFRSSTFRGARGWSRWFPHSALVSQQRIDPLGSLSAWPLAPIVALSLTVYAAFSTLQHGDQVTQPWLALLAVLLCAAAGVAHCLSARPTGSFYSGASALLVFGLAVAAMAIEVMSTWGSNDLLQDDFGHLALAMLIAAMAPYRPALQIASLAIVGALVAGVLAAAQAPFFIVVGVPPLERAVVAMVPVLGLGLAGAAYANQLGSAVLAWQRSAASSQQTHEQGAFDGLARTVQQEQLAALSDEVLPFLAAVAAAGEINEHDAERARGLARAVRASLVAELNHSWLEQLRMQPPVGVPLRSGVDVPMLTVHDASRRAFRMPGEQRTALAALLSELSTNSRLGASEITVIFVPDAAHPATRTQAQVQAAFSGREQQATAILRPYLNVMSLMFQSSTYTARGKFLDVKFRYDHEPSARQTGEPARR